MMMNDIFALVRAAKEAKQKELLEKGLKEKTEENGVVEVVPPPQVEDENHKNFESLSE